ncbi:MAG: bifunctional methylenetetrahydrofolate dehydrogenase/methenyltetrahydrofolate cyclohydrolase FolD [Myxococcota bacterium]|nr:bifunctional methylenetetrahydrofolate dehydrogenase/methenyltetrahydrofolate cyclohydrolase FolD [Myxococcota bacterium]
MIILDGKRLASERRQALTDHVSASLPKAGRPPGLSVILVGEDPASATYVRSKERAASKVGIRGDVIRLPASVTQEEVLAILQRLADDGEVDGILVQLPLPAHLDDQRILDAVPAHKDVDGFHALNTGLLFQQRPQFIPCTPLGITHLLDANGIDVSGKNALVVGRSQIVGRPMAELLLQRHATVTIAHSRSQNLEQLLQTADIIVAAVGRPEMIHASQLKPGCVVIDVGINRVDGKLVGDVCWQGLDDVASAATPVPGGVGPMTIAMLLENSVLAWRHHCNLP